MKITYYGHESIGCDYYRAVLPLGTLGKLNPSHKIVQKNNFNIINEMNKNSNSFMNDIITDAIVIPRVIKEDFVEKLVRFNKEFNKDGIIVYDQDDDIFNVSPLNPSYGEFGTQEYDVIVDGKAIPVWKTGVAGKGGGYFNSKKNQERLDCIRRNMERVDLITVTNDILKKQFEKINPNVKVLPNCIDMSRWKKPDFKETDEIRLFWSGGISHYEDLYYLKDPLRVIMEKYKNVKLVLMGLVDEKGNFRFAGITKDLPQDRVEIHDWEHTLAFPFKVSLLNPTIGLIPLKDTIFNKAKSPLKWIELSALKVPCVTSLQTPYKEMVDLSQEDNGIFIAENADVDAWVKGISILIEDKILRSKIGQAAYKTVDENFNIEKKCHLWADAYEEIRNACALKS